ncbi:MAG: nucleotide pyrophosphohydrolase [Cyanobacteriota bacterium]
MKTRTQIDKLTEQILKFRDDRDWEQFHNLKDLSIGLNIESSELMELFLWKNADEVNDFISNEDNKTKVEDELADIFIFCLLVANKIDADIEKIVQLKLEKNSKKYPVDKSKGSAKKYNQITR